MTAVTPSAPLIAGITADLLGLRAAIWVVAAITAVSGLVVAALMYETRQSPAPAQTPQPAPVQEE